MKGTDWIEAIRNELVMSGVPVGIRTHGKPRNAPSINPGPFGSICFRTFGRTYVELRPMGVLSEAERDRMMDAIRPFDSGAGLTVY